MTTTNATALQNFTKNFRGSTPKLAGVNTAEFGANVITSPGIVLGTATQLSDETRDYTVYLEVGTAGTTSVIKVGPTATVQYTVSSAGAATAGQVFTVHLPAGWYIKWTATTATIAHQVAISA